MQTTPRSARTIAPASRRRSPEKNVIKIKIKSEIFFTSFSKTSDFSTASQREAFEKLRKLEEEEEKIKKEKEDLMKFLELRSSYSKGSSRPVTVSSIVSRDSRDSKVPEESSLYRKKLEPIEEKREDKGFKPPKPAQIIKPKDEVGELLKSLY